jgi:choline dehydrogenase
MIIAGVSSPSFELFPYVVFGGCLEQVFSTGAVRLRSLDPAESPEIDLRMLSDDRDLRRMRMILRRTVELARSPEMAAVTRGAPVCCHLAWGAVPEFGEPVDDLGNQGAIDRWIVATAQSGAHATSTCALGSVVGPDCAVFGVEALRVVDASIAPVVPRANTNLTAIMIGEHAAKLLRGRVALPVARTSADAVAPTAHTGAHGVA